MPEEPYLQLAVYMSCYAKHGTETGNIRHSNLSILEAVVLLTYLCTYFL